MRSEVEKVSTPDDAQTGCDPDILSKDPAQLLFDNMEAYLRVRKIFAAGYVTSLQQLLVPNPHAPNTIAHLIWQLGYDFGGHMRSAAGKA